MKKAIMFYLIVGIPVLLPLIGVGVAYSLYPIMGWKLVGLALLFSSFGAVVANVTVPLLIVISTEKKI